MKKRTYFLSFIAATLLACAGCESTPEMEFDACECVRILNNKEVDHPFHDSCAAKVNVDKEFMEVFVKCQYAAITGTDTADVVIPENKPPELIMPSDGVYELDLEGSELRFLGKNSILGKKHGGTIQFLSGSVTITDTLLSAAEFVIDMTSVAGTGFDDEEESNNFAGHLMSADFFDSEKYPTATVVWTGDADNVFKLKGEADLTMKGVTKRIPLNVSLAPSDENNINIGGSLIINRTDFGVNYNSGSVFTDLGDHVIDDEVPVVFSLEISK